MEQTSSNNVYSYVPPLIFNYKTFRKYPKSWNYKHLIIEEETEKGLGVRTKRKIPAQKLVCEYSGEVLSEEMMLKRSNKRYVNL